MLVVTTEILELVDKKSLYPYPLPLFSDLVNFLIQIMDVATEGATASGELAMSDPLVKYVENDHGLSKG